MVLHKCLICTKEFKLKTDLERHKNKKINVILII